MKPYHYCACCHQRVAAKQVTRIQGLGFTLNACPKHSKILEEVKEHLANRLFMYRCNENPPTNAPTARLPKSGQ